MEPNLPRRKHTRLQGFDYSKTGYYFITICVKDRKQILSSVGRDDPGAPQIITTPIGRITEKYIQSVDEAYKTVCVDKYVIMPNHVHMILHLENGTDGAPGSSRPTRISDVIGCLKRLIDSETGWNIWQTSFYDHIIRSEADYHRIWQYIDENPAKWEEDEFYT